MFDRCVSIGLCATAIMIAVAGSAQSQTLPAESPHPRVAVVLSGGSAKGLTHLGALEVIEELGIPIDVVTGTSMGSIIGGLYAAGYSPAEIQKLFDDADWSSFFKRPTDRRQQSLFEKSEDQRFTITFPIDNGRPSLPAGAISRQSLAQHIERYLWPVHDVTDFMQLPTAFGALVTDLNTGDAILLRNGSLAAAMEGSAAVPGLFAPLKLADGRHVVDGAVNRNIPAEDARALGADLLICIDVSERIAPVDSLHTLVDILDQTVSFRVQASNNIERPLCNVIIEPEITGLSSTEFGKSSIWVRRGRSAALARHNELQVIADSVRALRSDFPARRRVPSYDSVFVRTVRWGKVSEGADAIAQGAITLGDSTWVTQALVEETASRAYSTGRFSQVSYRVVPDGHAHDLVFDLTERDRDQLGVGIRYDTPRGVALLASASVADLISPGSTASLSARLGQVQQFDARDVLGEGLNARFLQIYHVTLTHTTLPLLSVPNGISAPILDVRQVGAQIAHTVTRGIAVGLELSHEWSQDGAKGGDGDFGVVSRSATTTAVTASFDSRDRSFAPTRGSAVFVRSEVAEPVFGSDATFERHILDAQSAFVLLPGVSLMGRVHVGGASGVDLPLHDWFYLGGSVGSDVWSDQFVPFFGLKPQSVAGRSVRVLQGGIQADGPGGVILAVRGNVGNVFDGWPNGALGSGYVTGVGASISTLLAPGPLSLSMGTRSFHEGPVVELAFGASF